MPILNIKIAPAKMVTVSDDLGNSIEFPSFGSVSFNESEEWGSLLKLSREEGWLDRRYLLEAVAAVLKSRLPDDYPTEKTAQELLGNVPLTLIEEIWDFFYVSELNRGIDPRKKAQELMKELVPKAESEDPIGQDSISEPDSITPTNGILLNPILETAPLA